MNNGIRKSRSFALSINTRRVLIRDKQMREDMRKDLEEKIEEMDNQLCSVFEISKPVFTDKDGLYTLTDAEYKRLLETETGFVFTKDGKNFVMATQEISQ